MRTAWAPIPQTATPMGFVDDWLVFMNYLAIQGWLNRSIHVHYILKLKNPWTYEGNGARMVILSPQPSVSPAQERRNFFIGVALMVGAMFIIPFVDAIAKDLSARYSVTQITWARYFFHFTLMLPLVLIKHGPSAVMPSGLKSQIVRGGLLMCSTFLYFSAVALIPLTDALALVFIYPVIVTVLSAVILKEAVGIRRWTAVFIGLAGALIIIRPGFSLIGTGSLLALGAGMTYGCYLIATRRLANTAPPIVTLAFTALVGAVVFSCIVPSFWQSPTARDWGWMVALGGLAAFGHYMIIKAFEYAQASELAPFGYSEIIMTTVLGFVLFGDFPDALTWVGIAIIIASGIYISVRQKRKQT